LVIFGGAWLVIYGIFVENFVQILDAKIIGRRNLYSKRRDLRRKLNYQN